MRIILDKQYKTFEWSLFLHGKNYTFKEQFTGKFWDGSRYFGFGEMFANLMWINSIANSKDEQFAINDDFSRILELNLLGTPSKNKKNRQFKKNDIFSQESDSSQNSYTHKREDYSAIFYEVLAKLTFIVYNQAAYCIQYIRDAKYRSPKKFEEISSFICESLKYSKENTNTHDPNMYMNFLFSSLNEIEKLFNTLNRDNISNSQEVIYSLADIIKRYSANSKLIPRYQFERNDTNSGCVAAYLFSSPQSNEDKTLKGYLAFSGYNDCEDKSLFKAINGNSKDLSFPAEFIEKLHEIAEGLELKLITTNENICHCVKTSFKQIQPHTTLGIEVSAGQNRSTFGKKFACCERKIFTEFYKNDIAPPTSKSGYYEGTLHVKFPPCELCDLSIQYEHSQSHKFDVIWYIQQL